MKKFLLITFLSTTLFSCSKEELDLNDQMIVEMDLHLDNCATLAGPDNSVDLTPAQIEKSYYSVSRLETLYNRLLGEDVSNNGTWSPSIKELANRYANSSDKYGAYTSTYTVTDGDCTDYADITVNVVEKCNVDAGADNTSTVLTVSHVQESYYSVTRLEILYNSLIEDGVSTTGTFSPTIQEIASAYVDAEDKTGYYSTTYTVGTGNCIDTAELAVTVVADDCSVDAGPDNSITLTTSQIEEDYNSVSRIRDLYNRLLGDGVSSKGTWSPSIEEIASTYVNAEDKTGVYTSTYTIGGGDCSDSADISVVVTD